MGAGREYIVEYRDVLRRVSGVRRWRVEICSHCVQEGVAFFECLWGQGLQLLLSRVAMQGMEKRRQ